MKTITIEIPDDCEVKIVKKEQKKKELSIKTYQDLIKNNITIRKGYWINTDSIISPISNYSIVGSCSKNIATSEMEL